MLRLKGAERFWNLKYDAQSDDDLHPGARHEKSSSRLRQRQKRQSQSDRHDASPI
jgi:hypothetical protein